MQSFDIIPAGRSNYQEMIKVWEASVRATHTFLTEADIQHYKPLILNEYFDQVQLFCLWENEQILGFIGLDGDLIQMLFVDADARGKGIGKRLAQFAIEEHHATKVDVNEQNAQAVGFYEYLGFKTVERFDHDSAGKPYPILAMEISRNA